MWNLFITIFDGHTQLEGGMMWYIHYNFIGYICCLDLPHLCILFLFVLAESRVSNQLYVCIMNILQIH